MPQKRQRLAVKRSFSSQEWGEIRHGLIPEQMEDKWFIYTEGNTVYFHRSWTGFCVFTATVEPKEAGMELVDAWVSRDEQQYTGDDLEEDRDTLYQLIDRLLANGSSEGTTNDDFGIKQVT